MGRLGARDPGAAKTGIIETTMEPERYRFPGPAGVMQVASRTGREEEDDGPLVRIGDRMMLQGSGEALDGQIVEVIAERSKNEWSVQKEDGSILAVGQQQVTG